MIFLVNILFAILAFFVVRYIGASIAPEGPDKVKVLTVIALIVAIVVYFANFATQIGVK